MICKICLKEFIAKRSTARYCSNLCRQKNKRHKPDIIKELKAKIKDIENKPIQIIDKSTQTDNEIIPFDF
jgi:hypothetical protein